ncbi:trypsin-like peptidase domain-containing protein [Kitasatospora sp. NPDC059973]|uniref:nSTAND1 domain-containing NTPase n=1 Tax=Kitasatospora sp. NPDC059973 TaxID=3347020 RepID=UPI0036BF6F2B
MPGTGPGKRTGPGSGAKALDAAVLRVHDALARPVGAGFLVTPELALTCAHVVSAALAGQGVEAGVGSWVFVDLPLLPRSPARPAPDGSPRSDGPPGSPGPDGSPGPEGPDGPAVAGAMAVVVHWVPRASDGSGDVALLRLAAPLAGARPVRPVETRSEDVWGNPVRVFGFPVGRSDGVWHSGVLRDRQGGGLMQVDLAAGGYRVSGGFSGSPVWDDRLGGVVGMVVVAEAGDPAASYLIPTDGLIAAWPELRAVALAPSPFRSLTSFRESDAHVFHGRRAESEEVALLSARERWVTVVGPSGSGKSSLAMAGVVPRRRAAGALAVILRPDSGSTPLTALAAALLPLLEPELSETERLLRIPDLAAVLARPQGIADLAPRLLERHGARQLLLVLDQFEELLAFDRAAVDDLAAALFTDALPGTVRILTTLRADFLEAALAHPRLGPVISRQVYALGPMSREQLSEVVTAPVEAVPGVRYAPNLAERLLDDTGAEPGALPLLGFTLDLLWRDQSAGLLTHEAYEGLGGVKGALGGYAAGVLRREVPPADEQVARRLFTQLVRVPMGAVSATRRTALRTDLGEDEWRIAQALAADRLLVTGRSAEGVETVELAHEALINAWDKLRGWVEEDRAFLAWREVLRHDRDRWERSGRPRDLLPTTTALAGAQPWLRGRPGYLNEAERDYLERGRVHRRSRKRRWRWTAALLCVLLVAATAGGVLAERQSDAAARQAAIVHSKGLAARAQTLGSTDPGLAAQLAVAAYRASPTPEASAQLFDLSGSLLNSVVGEAGGPVLILATALHGTLAAALNEDGAVRIWDLADPSAPALRSTVDTGMVGIALTPDGSHLAGGCGGEGLCLWSLTDLGKPVIVARLPRLFDPSDQRVTVPAMATSADGTLLAAAGGNGDTLLWSIADRSAPKGLTRLRNPTEEGTTALAAVAFAPRGNLLASTVQGGRTQVWGLADPAAPAGLSALETGYKSIAFSPDGTLLAAGSQREVGLWRVTDPSAPDPIRVGMDGSANVSGVAFGRDSDLLAYGGTDVKDPKGDLCFASLSPQDRDLGSTKSSCTKTAFGVYAMATGGAGGLLTAGADGVVRRWRSPGRQVDQARQPGGPDSWSFSPDGHLMAAPQQPPMQMPPLQTQSVGIWDISDSEGPALVATLPVSARGTAFIRERGLLTIGWEGEVQLWNVSDPHHPVKAGSLGTAEFPATSLGMILTVGVTWSAPGAVMAVIGGGALHLWRVGDALDAVEVGSIPAPDSGGYDAGVLDHGRTAYLASKSGFEWWDIGDPAKPRRAGSSTIKPPDAAGDSGDGWNMGSAVSRGTAAGAVMAVTSTPDLTCKCSSLELFRFTGGGEPASRVTLPGAFGNALGLSRDNRLLAAAGNSGSTVTLWDITDPQHPRPRTSVQTLQDVEGIEFAENGELMTVWNSTALELWDVRDPTAPVLTAPVANPSGGSIRAVALVAAGPTLLVASNQRVSLLDTDPAELAARLCSYSTGAISRSQWEKYVPEVSYRDPCSSR